MTRHFGRVSLFLSSASWVVYFALLLVGGIDPSPELSRVLQTAVLCTVLVALLAFCLALFALVRGPQRVSAGFGLALCLLYGLVFSGLIFAVLAWL